MQFVSVTREWFDPTPEESQIVPISAATVKGIDRRIASCEYYWPQIPDISLDWLIDELTGSESAVTNYVLEGLASSQRCAAELAAKRRLYRCPTTMILTGG